MEAQKASTINAAIILDEVRVLSEEELRLLSRSVSKISPNHDYFSEDVILRELNFLSESLFKGAEALAISSTHRTAACNALCGFLEHGMAVTNQLLWGFCYDHKVWDRMLRLCLEKAGGMKPKVIRQVIMTIVRVVAGNTFPYHAAPYVTADLIENATFTSLALFYVGEERNNVRAAMHLCEILLMKQLISPNMLYQGIIKARALLKSQEIHEAPGTNGPLQPDSSFEDFVRALIPWVQYPDTAPSTGRLLKRLFICAPDNRWPNSAPGMIQEGGLPLWRDPLRDALYSNPELFEAIRNHVLPELLQIDYPKSLSWFNAISPSDLQCNNLTSLDEPDIQVGLSIISILLEKGLEHLLSDYRHSDAYQVKGDLSTMAVTPETQAVNLEAQVVAPETQAVSEDLNYQKIAMRFLGHRNSNFAIAALSILTFSVSDTKPFSQEILATLQHYLPFFHAESDCKVRGDFLTVMKKAIQRLDGVLSRILRRPVESSDPVAAYSSSYQSNKENQETSQETSRVLELHLSFLECYVEYLKQELQPTASYQRHIIALRILRIMQKSNLLRFLQDDACLLPRLLTDLVLDPFEDVREASSELLANWTPPKGQISESDVIPACRHSIDCEKCVMNGLLTAYSRAERLMIETSRADIADGTGRLNKVLSIYRRRMNVYQEPSTYDDLYQALYALEKDVEMAKLDIRHAVSKAPLHGRLIAVRYLIDRHDFYDDFEKKYESPADAGDAWKKLTERLILTFDNVWVAVKQILCFDSPEGHVPEEAEEDDLDIGVKDALSFSWRALKESSSLMHVVITNPNYESKHDPSLNEKDLSRMGDLAFAQLAELRHRGAFSTVAQTFAACCSRCAGAKQPSVRNLLQKWFKDTLNCIYSKSMTLTRRSAGLPAMITAILIAATGEALFENVIAGLQQIAKSPVEKDQSSKVAGLPQVHALNCLKDAFSNSRLGSLTERFLADTLKIAVDCLDDEIWAIRNCGLMLFKGLLIRLTGGQSVSTGNKRRTRSSNTIHEKYPRLSKIIVHLLHVGSSFRVGEKSPDLPSAGGPTAKLVEVIYPAMEIIEKIGMASSSRDQIISLLISQLGSPISGVREKSANILSHELDGEMLTEKINEFLLLKPPRVSQNALHGWLLCLKLKVASSVVWHTEHKGTTFSWIVSLYDELVSSNPCPITAATYFEVLTLCVKQQHCGKDGIARVSLCERLQDTWDSLFINSTLKSRQLPGNDAWPMFGFKPLLYLTASDHPSLPAILENFQEYYAYGQDDDFTEISILSTVLQTSSLGWTCRASAMDNLFTRLSEEYKRELSSPKTTDEVGSGFYRIRKALPFHRNERDCSTYPLVYFNSALTMFGALIALQPWEEIVQSPDLVLWLEMVQTASDDSSDLSSRIASVKSLMAFGRAFWHSGSSGKHKPQFLDVYLAIYNTLLDDDDHVRDIGASLACHILASSCNPLAAAEKLLTFLISNYGNSKDLCAKAFARMTGAKFRYSKVGYQANITSLDLEPASTLMITARKEDHSLFVEEKQNLFRDDVQEAQRMVHILLSSRLTVTQRQSFSALRDWTCSGLETLIEVATHEHLDGPLGWTSKPAVYTLGMRIFCAAKVFVSWDLWDARAKEVGSMVESVEKFLEVGKAGKVHGLWMREAEAVIEIARGKGTWKNNEG